MLDTLEVRCSTSQVARGRREPPADDRGQRCMPTSEKSFGCLIHTWRRPVIGDEPAQRRVPSWVGPGYWNAVRFGGVRAMVPLKPNERCDQGTHSAQIPPSPQRDWTWPPKAFSHAKLKRSDQIRGRGSRDKMRPQNEVALFPCCVVCVSAFASLLMQKQAEDGYGMESGCTL